MKYYFVTSSIKKFTEAKKLLQKEVHMKDLPIVEIQGTSEEIIRSKLNVAFKQLILIENENFAVIVDDVSLNIECLNNFPGPYVKYFMQMGMTNIKKLLQNVDKKAIANCHLGIACYNKTLKSVTEEFFIGSSKGCLVFEAEKNEIGFGFDPIFRPDDCDKTFAELGDAKNLYSHRYKAFQLLNYYIEKAGQN